MDEKKLIEGLPIELKGSHVVIGGYSYAKDYVSKQSEWHGAGPLLTIGWRVLLALMDDPPGNTWSCPDFAEEGQESLASASCLGGKTEITVESVRRQWKPGDSFVDDEEGNAHFRAVLNVSAGTIYATDGTRHRVAMCRHVEHPSDFFSGPEWDEKWDRKYVPDDPVAVGLARARSIRKAIDYLLAKEKP